MQLTLGNNLRSFHAMRWSRQLASLSQNVRLVIGQLVTVLLKLTSLSHFSMFSDQIAKLETCQCDNKRDQGSN